MTSIVSSRELVKTRNVSLDGLRGIAVLLVVAHHISGSLVPFGGPVGVILFFVLSGFLITRLLLNEQNARGRIDLKAFYLRRVLRLYPALLTFLMVLPLLLFAVRDSQVGDYWWKGLASATYVTNLFQAHGYGFGILTHTWSLAVEEQFYIVWPGLLITVGLLVKWCRTHLNYALLALLMAAIAWRLIGMEVFPSNRVYFGPDTNAFALLGGAFLGSLRVLPRLPQWVGYFAVTLLGTFSLLRLPGPHEATANQVTLFAALAAFIAVWAAAGGINVLRWKPLVWLGTISYGLYLWHDALLKIEPAGFEATGLTRVAVVGLAIGVAWCSYKWVEVPALALKSRFERSTL